MWPLLTITWSRLAVAALHLAISLILLLASAQTSGATLPSPGDSTRDSDLFAGGPIRFIRIEVQRGDVESLRKRSRKYVRAAVHVDGKDYPDVGIHLKGSSGSFRGIDDKPGLTLDFGRFVSGQKLRGIRKLHLNNSVEDPSYVNESIGSELFRAAGIPAPRVSHAVVELNGRRLGLYGLKEGVTEDFLSLYFKRTDGRLYDTEEGNASDENRALVTGIDNQSRPAGLSKLMTALAREPDSGRRWALLEGTLDLDRFITFMAVEIMICHRDGYCLARNNFRIYADPESNRMIFLPHGMDQLFGKADLPWRPHFAGAAARAVMDTVEGQQRYAARFRELFAKLLVVDRLTNRVNQIVAGLRPSVGTSEFTAIQREAAVVQDRIANRALGLRRQLDQPDLVPIRFQNNTAALSDWTTADESVPGATMEATDPDGVPFLGIVAGTSTSASWRTTARLKPGRYRFEGLGKTIGVKPLQFGKNQGAALRLAGSAQRSVPLTGDSSWTLLDVEFQIATEGDVELICELRASAGEVRFDRRSLRLIAIE